MSKRIVFHGENAACFSDDFKNLVEGGAEIALLPDQLVTEEDRNAYRNADIIVGVKFDASLPTPERLTLFHVPGAGYDAVNLDLLPKSAVVCNCFGHDPAIAEYVFSAILNRHVPLRDADNKLRAGQWAYWSGSTERLHDEMSGKTIGLLGFGHIGKAIAVRAKAFGMQVSVANRSRVETSDLVDRSFTLDQLNEFWPTADFIVVSVPLTDTTRGIVDAEAFAAMKSGAVIINVGRGPTIDEQALYDALKGGTIGGAVIDTWYAYPSPDAPTRQPSALPFNQLENIIMTPHMSGWTSGTVRRRQQTIAENINRRLKGQDCINIVRTASE
ncbi:Hydroxypyruvate reductase [Agrobacterium fabrum]|jgi:phosphoglycerate dehydrogenase-like enzyme|uniref:2-hydroxyacid dehydrogenase n=1 Tax=Agrobacterium fabrum TaxID=1176649 RepID=UPI001DBCFE34|nr:2-hydroxyacid dehydrogenase [Agrobacterium fabrum]CAH0148726.1 Hydroxypyruvate reductase [Agrobacterium fabrum]CAH0168343.1 Hydroxypyruvate reductase [Agrobacterium fabrum]